MILLIEKQIETKNSKNLLPGTNKSQMATSSACCLPHDPATGASLLGVSVLTPSLNPRPLPELLPFMKGEKLQVEIVKAHPYAFNMGSSRILQDYKEAAKVLMERNMPEVLHDRQTEVVFIPECHLPKEPRVIDLPEFESRKRKWDEMAQPQGSSVLEQMGMKPGTPKELQHARGDLVEKELFEELKRFYRASLDKEVVVYHGPVIRKPKESKAYYQESDFVIVNKNTKTVYDIECKTIMTGIVGKKAIKQNQNESNFTRTLRN